MPAIRSSTERSLVPGATVRFGSCTEGSCCPAPEAQLRERAGADFACGQGRFRFERADDANEIEVIGCRRKAVYADTPGGWHRMTDFEPAETE